MAGRRWSRIRGLITAIGVHLICPSDKLSATTKLARPPYPPLFKVVRPISWGNAMPMNADFLLTELRRIRQSRGLSLNQVAQAASFSQNDVLRWSEASMSQAF